MAILSVQDQFQSGDNVTATNLNNLVNQANFVGGAGETTDGSTLEVHTNGYLKVKNNGVGDEHLQQMTDAEATTAGDENGRAVTTNHIRNDAVTYAKIQNVSATDRVLGRDSAGAGEVEEITPAALRTMINVEDGAEANPGNATAHTSDADSDGINDTGGTDGLLSAEDKTKLDGIAAGAEENVQSDWNQTDNTADDFINNKPTIAYTSAISNATAHTNDTNSDGINDTGGGDGLMSAEDKTKLDGLVSNATHTGDVTGSTELTIAGNAVTFAKMQNINTATVIGRTTANTGNPEEVAIKNENDMASNSATALATQQSIKAYVDSQTVSKAAITDTTTPTAYGSVTYTHNLGTADISYDIYAHDSTGVEHNIKSEIWAGTVSAGATVTNITSTQITIKYLEKWLDWTGATSVNDPNPNQKQWSDATLIKIVVIG